MTTEPDTAPDPFIAYLRELHERADRGALAALRRSVGHPPGTYPPAYPYVARFTAKAPPWRKDAIYLIAGLFALHPEPGGRGNMGYHLARVAQGNPAVERRFQRLVATADEQLAAALPSVVRFLKSQDVPIDWGQLFRDVQAWGHPDRYVQQNWAAAFWNYQAETPESSAATTSES